MRVHTMLLTIGVALMNTGIGAAQSPDRQSEPTRAAQEHSATGVAMTDRKFLQLAIDGGAKEVQLSEQAQEKAQSALVKEFAARIVDDHSQSNKELLELNQKLLTSGGPPYKRVSSSVRKEVEQLNRLTGADFDRRYMQIMLEDHEESVALFEREVERGRDPQLKALAQKQLPTLRDHLQRARKLSETLKK